MNLFGKDFLLKLMLPLVGILGASIYLNTKWEWNSFYLNLATEIIAIIITIGYVNWILQQSKKREWTPVTQKIQDRLVTCLNSIGTSIRIVFDIKRNKIKVSINELSRAISKGTYFDELLELLTEQLLVSKLQQMNQQGWKFLADEIRGSYDQLDTFLNAFSHKLSPQQYEKILEIHDLLRDIEAFHILFPELLGVTDINIKVNKTDSIAFQKTAIKSTATSIRKVLEISRELFDLKEIP